MSKQIIEGQNLLRELMKASDDVRLSLAFMKGKQTGIFSIYIALSDESLYLSDVVGKFLLLWKKGDDTFRNSLLSWLKLAAKIYPGYEIAREVTRQDIANRHLPPNLYDLVELIEINTLDKNRDAEFIYTANMAGRKLYTSVQNYSYEDGPVMLMFNSHEISTDKQINWLEFTEEELSHIKSSLIDAAAERKRLGTPPDYKWLDRRLGVVAGYKF